MARISLTPNYFDPETGKLFTELLYYDDANDDLFSPASNTSKVFLGGGNDKIYLQARDDWANGQLGNDTIYGGSDQDTLYGDEGDDYLYGDFGNDSLFGGNGNDALDGGPGDDRLSGDGGNDVLDGNFGVDYLDGGSGDDYYYVDNPNDVVVEYSTSGNDVVGSFSSSYTLSANVEYLSLFSGAISGTGNELNNVIYAYEDNNILDGADGDDFIEASEGNDSLQGGRGNDVLYGGGQFFPTTNTGNDLLDGGSGNDTMYGQDGNDTYVVDSIGDVVVEDSSTGGSDTVQTFITYTIGANIESLSLMGTAAINGTGNDLSNSIFGNNANNILNGGNGDDFVVGGEGNDTLTGGNGNDVLRGGIGRNTLTGGLGADIFELDHPGVGPDTIKDFNSSFDDIYFYSFPNISGFPISNNQFRLGSTALDSDDRFIYNRSTGGLFFDQDGIGGLNQTLVVTLSNKASLSASDIIAF